MPQSGTGKSCFVIMPFGEKKDVQGTLVDFDDIYDGFIAPTIEGLGYECDRCDRVDESGNIHRRMFELLWNADLAIADLSLLNPNVFYELGIRHALRKSMTILLRRQGTRVPFNIANLSVIEYDESSSESRQEAQRKIAAYVEAGYQKGHVDYYVSEVLGLSISDTPVPVPERRVLRYQVDELDQQLCIITGDLRNIHDIDIWVNSENTNMQMARYYDFSVSSVIRYEGAEKTVTGHVKDDTIQTELLRVMDGERNVPPGHVIPTSPGQLATRNGVKWVFHAAAVAGSLGRGYRVIPSIEDCVTNSLRLADDAQFRDEHLRSILLPLFGISTNLKSERDTVRALMAAAISYLRNYPSSRMQEIYFLAWSEEELELCTSVLAGEAGVREIAK